MNHFIMKRVFPVAVFALASATTHAAGLGRLSVTSGLGEPLSADIEVFGAPNELASMVPRLASPEDYAAMGLERPPALDAVRIGLEKKADGSTVLHLNSARPVEDPFMELVVQVEWQNGKLSREYNALLDPPGFGERTNVAKALPVVPDSKPGSASAPKSLSADKVPVPISNGAGNSNAAPTDLESSVPQTYVTKRGDTLRQIAVKLKLEDSSVEQMIVGLYRGNTGAFVKGNLNRLKVGQTMVVPNAETLEGISQEDAIKEIKLQTANWSAYRAKLARMAVRSAERKSPMGNVSGTRATAEDTQRQGEQSRYVLKVSPGDIEYSLGAQNGKKNTQKD